MSDTRLLMGYDLAGLEPKTRAALDDALATIQTWAGKVDGANAALTSGSYIPILTPGENTTTDLQAFECQYMRVGANVTVHGRASVNPLLAAPTFTNFYVSLPIASRIAFVTDVLGVMTASDSVTPEAGEVIADLETPRAWVRFYATNATGHFVVFTFQYVVR